MPKRDEAVILVLLFFFFTYLFSTEFIQYKYKYVVTAAIKRIKPSVSYQLLGLKSSLWSKKVCFP